MERRQRLIFAGVIITAILVHARSLDIFFYNDDLQILQQFVSSSNLGSWLFARVVDHIILVPKLFYGLFYHFFGLNSLPWHVLILSVHVLNLLLLNLLLQKAEISFPSRMFAVGCFAITTVFHECIYWIGASTFMLCLPFSLAACVFARLAEERGSYISLLALSVTIAFALFSVSTGVAAILLAPLSLVSMPAGAWSKTRAMVSAFLSGLAGCVPYVLALHFTNAFEASALQRFDPVAATLLTGRSIIERLAGRYFTGASLPLFAAGAVFLIAVLAAASNPHASVRSNIKRLIPPFAWMIIPTWLILSFRSWMGDVVFVSRYQLFPAVGFSWLIACSVEAIAPRFSKQSMLRIFRMVLIVAFIFLIAIQSYASHVAHQRWLARTEGLKQSHEEIAAGIRSLLRTSKEPVIFSDHLIAGGEGWRPTLHEFTQYVLNADERKRIVFKERDAALKYGVDPRLLPFVDDLRSGNQNWLTWLDDLSVSEESDSLIDQSSMSFQTTDLFPQRSGAEFHFDANRVSVSPRGIGYVAELTSAPRSDVSHWTKLHFHLRAKDAGELLISFGEPTTAPPDRGARIRFPEGKLTSVAVDVPLAARGPISGQRVIRITFTNVLTSYEVGPIGVSCSGPCK